MALAADSRNYKGSGEGGWTARIHTCDLGPPTTQIHKTFQFLKIRNFPLESRAQVGELFV